MKDFIDYSFFLKKITIIIFYTLLKLVYSGLYFNYPYAIKLDNNKIFVIHQEGVTICNENFTESEERVITFCENERITSDETLAKVTSVKGNAHLICLINDKIYIFAKNGRFLNKTEELITDKNIEYYSLVHLRADSDSYYEYFAVGFISNGAINLTTYNYKISDKSINMNYNWNITNSYQIKNNALNCHYMSYTTYSVISGYQIVCLYYVHDIGIALQKLEYYSTYLKFDYKKELMHFFNNNIDEVNYIKGALLSDEQHLLLAWITSGGIPYYYIYDISKNENITIHNNYFQDSICESKLQGFTVNYFNNKNEDEFIYTCLGRNIMAKNIKYNNLNIINSNYKYDNCTVHGLSIIYLESTNDYYIISDANCNNKLKPLDLLFGQLKDEDITIETEYPVDYYKICNISTTIITTIPTTIITIIPTTIITTIPSTIITTFPTTIITTILTNAISTIPESTISSVLTTAIATPETSIALLPTTIMSTISTTYSTRITTTEIIIPTTYNKEIICPLKCEICNEESISHDLCISCNNINGYYFLNKEYDNTNNNSFIDCVNNETKPIESFFDIEYNEYRICYKTCATCDLEGNDEIHNCKTCEKDYIFDQDIINIIV